jgi:hypothetical protein
MLHKFRVGNNLSGKQYNELFIYRSDIARQQLGPDDSLVLIDDFSGTGDQVTEAWKAIYQELTAGIGRIYLALVAARRQAIARISEETNIEVVPSHILDEGDDVFSDSCSHFDNADKTALLSYCKQADNKLPRGKGNCGLLLVFAHTCPNNSIPIIRVSHSKWEGLFKRND